MRWPGGAVRGKPKLTLAELNTKFRDFLLDVYELDQPGAGGARCPTI